MLIVLVGKGTYILLFKKEQKFRSKLFKENFSDKTKSHFFTVFPWLKFLLKILNSACQMLGKLHWLQQNTTMPCSCQQILGK